MIYCGNCENLKFKDKLHWCDADENVYIKLDWFSKRRVPKHKPEKLNKNNDCPWWHEKNE